MSFGVGLRLCLTRPTVMLSMQYVGRIRRSRNPTAPAAGPATKACQPQAFPPSKIRTAVQASSNSASLGSRPAMMSLYRQDSASLIMK